MKKNVTAEAANNASRLRKPNKSSDQQIALHLCYGQIGISAVAAAARYQGGSRLPAVADRDAHDAAVA
jgi:hypothetical protein